MKYVLSGSMCWADEFDVHFFEVLNERDKAIYDMANEIFEHWYSGYGFGTNEGWDDDFNYLGWNLIEITDEEYEVLKKCKISGETVYDRFSEELCDEISSEGFAKELEEKYGEWEWFDKATLDEMREVFLKFKEILA